MQGEIREKLGEALKKIDRPGSFCVAGSTPTLLPGLEVPGLGPVGLPLTGKQAKDLIQCCDRAAYGKGEETLVDPSVRRVWRLAPDKFSLTNPEWDGFVAAMVARVQEELGLEKQKLESHLYDLLLYDPGSFFLPHRDGEKRVRMVATLVIALPSPHEGGELVVRHDGQERTIDFQDDDGHPFHIHYAAFYADCEHEVRPLRKGYRLCLVYNLTLAKSKKTIPAPRDSEHIERIGQILGVWAEDNSARKLAITLEHQYTQDGLAWDALKGVDRARARVLLEGARKADCQASLALLTLWESGSAEDPDDGYGYGYGRRRRWHDRYADDEEDEKQPSKYVMEDVYDTKLTAAHWSDAEGHALAIGELKVDEDEVLDLAALKGVTPEEEYEGYTGNEGMTLERWYRNAAIFVWPERRHFSIICGRDSRPVVPLLTQKVEEWRRARGKEAAALKIRCLVLADAIIEKWPASQGYVPADQKETRADELLQAIAELEKPRLIADFLGELMIKDFSVDPGELLVSVCQKQGWVTSRDPLLALMKGTTEESMERNVRLLERISSARPRKKEGWGELRASLAQELVAAIEVIDRRPSTHDWHSPKADRGKVLAGLVRSLLEIGQDDLLARVAVHALALPRKYSLASAHMRALVDLKPWLKKNVKGPSPALAGWVASCRQQLESLTDRVPQEPEDFRRASAIKCKCAECVELGRFLEDPRESVHRFRMKKERRQHLAHEIHARACDLDMETDLRGSPQTLVCTKNMASYKRTLKKYHEDREHLATVRSIEEALPR